MLDPVSEAFQGLADAGLLGVKAFSVAPEGDVTGDALGQRTQFSGEFRVEVIPFCGC